MPFLKLSDTQLFNFNNLKFPQFICRIYKHIIKKLILFAQFGI